MKQVIQGKNVDKLMALVREQQQTTFNTRARMDDDIDLLRLKSFQWEDPELDWETFTSNDPLVYYRKYVSWIADSNVIVQSPYAHARQDARDKGRITEKFFKGIVNIADDILTLDRVEPKALPQLASYGALRGFMCGLHLLRITEDYKTVPEIQIWDPRHTYWGMDGEGIAWVCHVMLKDEGNIFDTWDTRVTGTMPHAVVKGQRVYEVFDFYDRHQNCVFADGKFVKRPQPHGALGLPCSVILVDMTPLMVNNYSQETMSAFGESIFAPVRSLYREKDALMATGKEMTKRTLRPPAVLQDAHGAEAPFTGDNPDVFEAGAITPTPPGTILKALETPDLSRDWAVRLNEVNAQIQRGTFPNVVYGETPGALSGVAINELGRSVGSTLKPVVDAARAFMTNVERTCRRQYASGIFPPIQVAGVASNREIFYEQITPDMLVDAPAPMIRLSPTLPFDRAEKISVAMQLVEGKFISRRYALDAIIEVEDPDSVMDQVLVEQAEQGHPIAVFREMIRAMYERGDTELADLYLTLAKKFAFQEGVQIMALAQAAAQGADPQMLAALIGDGGQPGLEQGRGGGVDNGGGGQQTTQTQGRIRGGDPNGGFAPAGFNRPPPADDRQRQGGRPQGSPTVNRTPPNRPSEV